MQIKAPRGLSDLPFCSLSEYCNRMLLLIHPDNSDVIRMIIRAGENWTG